VLDTILERIATYPALFVACALSGMGIPMPEDVPLLVTGLQLAEGRFSWAPALLTAFAGCLTRDTLAWLVGRQLGARLLDAPWARRVLPVGKLDRAREMIAERGNVAVLAGRFMIGFRVPMFLTAGASGVPLASFLAWDLLGMVVAVPAIVCVGYFVGPPALTVAMDLLPHLREILVVVALLAGAWFGTRWLRQRNAASGDEA
jgi:membrane protein DedA with SNARE-associated domain